MPVLADDAPVRVEPLEGDAVWRVIIGGSKGNVLDGAVMKSLDAVSRAATEARQLKAMVVEGEGKHFSFGASVPEHLPEHVEKMLRSFHGALRALAECNVVTLAAVRGQCLGGGLELALVCHRIFASPGAHLGQPEIALGVFAPVASVLLPERVGRAHAEDLCLTGRVVGADEALAMGLVDVVAEDPADAALAWAREHLLPRSASSLRHAVRAVRYGLRQRLGEELDGVERLYLDDLMATKDAAEGIRSFLEKRQPAWSNA